jgi:hypothetical protein
MLMRPAHREVLGTCAVFFADQSVRQTRPQLRVVQLLHWLYSDLLRL